MDTVTIMEHLVQDYNYAYKQRVKWYARWKRSNQECDLKRYEHWRVKHDTLTELIVYIPEWLYTEKQYTVQESNGLTYSYWRMDLV